MRFLFVALSLFVSVFIFSQGEVINPIISKNKGQVIQAKRSDCSIDSTFIYTSDTLSLPFLDEFSKNHFQKYDADFLNPTVSFEKYYKLTDLGGTKLANNLRFTSQQTMRKVVNVSELSVTDEIFPTQDIKIADLCAYPVSYTTTPVYPPYIIFDTVDFVNPPDTIWLTEVEYFQDSATQFFSNLNNKNAFWLDSKAEHNYTNALNPWTLGVATFDGTDETGTPYLFGSNSVDFNDFLTSKPINLSTVDANQDVYLSFLYQPQGLNDEPESGDSLILEFFAPDLNQWFHIWSVGGSPVSDFKRVHIKLTDANYFKSAFQFRFKNYSGVSGGIDQFHVDYVHLRAGSGFQDTLFKDFALVYPLNTLLKDYTQVPWDHFKNNPSSKTANSLEVSLRNGSNVQENFGSGGNVAVSYQGVNEGNIPLLGQNLANGQINYLPFTFHQSQHDVSSSFDFSSAKTGDFQEFDVTLSASAQFTNLPVNDSTTYKQRFYDSYAYDDGSAEAAFGPTGTQARLAYKFIPYENDTLRGVKMRFVQSVNNVTNKLFLLSVWNDNNGKPGDVIYEDNFLYPRQPSYDYDDSLGFTNYYFKDLQKLPINGTFYVGWRQLDETPLNIGFDWNIDNSDKIFYSINNGVDWSNSSFDGSLLMRPIFATSLNKNLSVNEITKEEVIFNIYPNPSSDKLFIETNQHDFSGIDLFDLQGKLLYSSSEFERSFEINHLINGIYIVKDKSSGSVKKIVKN
ncbi:MAG: T9SS type A sorting domain-containing protein [Bacteroidota bacterium]